MAAKKPWRGRFATLAPESQKGGDSSGSMELWVVCVQGGAMGLQLAMIGVLAGTALGLRYKVFVLVPAVTLAMIFAAMAGIAHGNHLGSIILAMVILGATIQLGYLTGIAIYAAGPILASLIGGRGSQLNSHMHN
jgi:hypothetical protein